MEQHNSCSSQDFREYQFIFASPWQVSVFACSTSLLLSLCAIFGNAFILVALHNCRSISSTSKVLFQCLALSDFGVGLVAQPLHVASTVGVLLKDIGFFCSVQPFYAAVAYFFGSISFATMTAVSVDRYLALRLRMQYRLVVTVKRVLFALLFLWISGALWAASRMWNIMINKISGLFIGFLSVIITSLCYFWIYWTLNHLNAKVRTHQASTTRKPYFLNMARYRKSVNSMLCVFSLFIACYMPYLCALIVVAFEGYNTSVVLATNMTSLVIFFNSSLNPFVYCWRIREIRGRVIQIARKICPPCGNVDELNL